MNSLRAIDQYRRKHEDKSAQGGDLNAPSGGGPDAHGRVEAASDDPDAVKGDGVDLVKVTPVHEQTFTRVDVPELRRQ